MAYLVPTLATLRAEFNSAFPGRSKSYDGWIGDDAHAKTKSDHNPDEKGRVRAVDLTAEGARGAALAEVVATTEADYDARIDLVTVGDAVVDDRLAALVAATREAVVNAAKHAGAPATVYAEVDEEQVEVNVRDRGVGFVPDDVGADRHGVRESITARMAAVGGSATLRSAPGEGTEVRLVLPVRGASGA